MTLTKVKVIDACSQHGPSNSSNVVMYAFQMNTNHHNDAIHINLLYTHGLCQVQHLKLS